MKFKAEEDDVHGSRLSRIACQALPVATTSVARSWTAGEHPLRILRSWVSPPPNGSRSLERYHASDAVHNRHHAGCRVAVERAADRTHTERGVPSSTNRQTPCPGNNPATNQAKCHDVPGQSEAPTLAGASLLSGTGVDVDRCRGEPEPGACRVRYHADSRRRHSCPHPLCSLSPSEVARA